MQPRFVIMAVLVAGLAAGTFGAAQDETTFPLPAPQTDGGKPLMQALRLRATSRAFATDPLPPQTLSNLLWAAWGVNRPQEGKRTAPSPHNWQETDVVVVTARGAFVYDAVKNALRRIVPDDLRALTGTQDFVKEAPVTLVYVADTSRLKGQASEMEKWAYADAAFISQNVSLFCASEGLATGVRAMIDRPALAKALKLREEQIITLAQSVGFPKASGAPKPAASAPEWFQATKVAEGVFRIDDHGADNLYLVEGSERALLIDTGLGVADVMAFVRTLTSRPVDVVITHGHPDHAGGIHQFETVHGHPNDFELARFASGRDQRAGMAANMLTTSVRESSFYRGPERETRLVPVGSGLVFDLGGRRLEVIEVPGHTRGGLVLLDAARKLLFTGDNYNTQEWMFLKESTTLEAYLRTLEALERRGAEFETILPGPGGSLDQRFLGEQIQAARQILDGTCQGEPHHTFAGDGRICRYERAAIVFDPARLR
jgi:glyoxylase-like metal-dependent hydrolase (beta-lactamase superfamily II)